MKRHLVILLVLLLIIPIYAMAKKPDKNAKPQWVDDPKSEYPESRYLSAVGSSGSRAEAENNAAANLAKIFRSEISTSTSYQERYNELMSETESEASTETQSSKNVQVKANQNLFNIEIGKAWTDKLGQVYAVAYIDRFKTADIYEEKIDENSRQIQHYLQQGLISSHTWKVYACYNIAAIINQNTEELMSQLAIISLDTQESIELGYEPNELKSRVAEFAKGIHFRIEATGDADEKVKSIIEEVITANGFTNSELNAATIKVDSKLENVELNQPQKFVRYYLTINVYDPSGNSIITLSENSREGHINQDEARARAIRTMSAKIRTDLPKKLFQYFDSLVINKKR
jgi:hypothetical protein